MIKVERTNKPVVLGKNEKNWSDKYLTAKQNYSLQPTSDNKKKQERAETKYRHKDIKDAVIEMFKGKCAYCESKITHVDYGHIEHFRPKKKYPQLCFDWNNMLLACGVCNGREYKGENFPLETEGGLLINPVEEQPDHFFRFEFDSQTGIAIVIPLSDRGDTSVKLLGLNRPKLVKYRSEIVALFAVVAKLASEGDIESLNKMHHLSSNSTEYSAFAIELLKKYNL